LVPKSIPLVPGETDGEVAVLIQVLGRKTTQPKVTYTVTLIARNGNVKSPSAWEVEKEVGTCPGT
jgi:hypothetical protein